MPPGISQKFKGYGWHQDESRLILVTREPRMYRIPDDHTYNLRTTWLRTTKGWVQFENRIKWTNLSPKTPKFEEWGDRGVFLFDSHTIKATPLVQLPIWREMIGKIFGAASNPEAKLEFPVVTFWVGFMTWFEQPHIATC